MTDPVVQHRYQYLAGFERHVEIQDKLLMLGNIEKTVCNPPTDLVESSFKRGELAYEKAKGQTSRIKLCLYAQKKRETVRDESSDADDRSREADFHR